MTLITDSGALQAFCARQTSARYIAVDTEFLRDSSYWPRLCLVQIAGPEDAAVIDVLAPDLDHNKGLTGSLRPEECCPRETA